MVISFQDFGAFYLKRCYFSEQNILVKLAYTVKFCMCTEHTKYIGKAKQYCCATTTIYNGTNGNFHFNVVTKVQFCNYKAAPK